LEELHAPEEKLKEQFLKDLAVDPSRYKGLHGTAVLSRYPIRSAKNMRLKVCHDWFADEKKVSELEKGKRLASENVFLEKISREVRHGNRFALVVELEVPESPTGLVTVVAVHLENKCRPTCRKEQLEELLVQLQAIKNPLVMGGDLNTTGADGAPTSIGREIKKRVRNPNFWASQAISWFSPIALPNLFIGSANYVKNYQDPTAVSVPLVAVNREARLFDKLEKFRFDDGGSFDFAGYKMRSINGREGTLADSNERAAKGFTPTFEFRRDYKGLVGQLRLDWLLVKPAVHQGNHPLHFTPWYGRTLDHLNEAVPGQISDHHPITVDLALSEKSPNALFRSSN
jgi:endonuclease/exonuclease/phosphatase family metal-dependent hydrolase